ncbi:MAG: molybdopterin dehydrogenase, partial [Phototrophicales bacterium]
MWHTYHQVTNIQQALMLLAENSNNARIMAGGTDLILELERGQRDADVLIDITRIDDLHRITYENGVITLGALVTHN